jgi:glutamate racemase
MENAAFLNHMHIKVLVIACHTACTAALEQLKQAFSFPVIGIMEQGIEEAIQRTRTQKIAIAGTRATIASHVYQQRIQERLPGAEIHAIACPLLVPLVEEGYIEHPIASLALREYFGPLQGKDIDTLLLGCTHYPLLKDLMRQELSDAIVLIDPAKRCAETIASLLAALDLLNPQTTVGSHTFYVTDDSEKFRHLGQTFLNAPICNISCVKV